MDDLIIWLRQQLDAQAERATKLLVDAQRTALTLQDPRLLGKYMPGSHDWPAVEQSCAELLAEVEAKRALLEALQIMSTALPTPVGYPSAARTIKVEVELAEEQAAQLLLRLLAQPYAGRDGWREEWADTHSDRS